MVCPQAKVLGFGNQVEGLLSTLMFAMMTKRVFVIDWGRDHNGVDPLELFQDLPLEADLRVFLPHFATIMDDNHLRTLQRKARLLSAPYTVKQSVACAAINPVLVRVFVTNRHSTDVTPMTGAWCHHLIGYALISTPHTQTQSSFSRAISTQVTFYRTTVTIRTCTLFCLASAALAITHIRHCFSGS